jgi:hypothetical protein
VNALNERSAHVDPKNSLTHRGGREPHAASFADKRSVRSGVIPEHWRSPQVPRPI